MVSQPKVAAPATRKPSLAPRLVYSNRRPAPTKATIAVTVMRMPRVAIEGGDLAGIGVDLLEGGVIGVAEGAPHRRDERQERDDDRRHADLLQRGEPPFVTQRGADPVAEGADLGHSDLSKATISSMSSSDRISPKPGIRPVPSPLTP